MYARRYKRNMLGHILQLRAQCYVRRLCEACRLPLTCIVHPRTCRQPSTDQCRNIQQRSSCCAVSSSVAVASISGRSTTRLETLPIQRMQHSMSGAICCRATSIALPTLSIFQALASNSPLVDLTVLSPRKRHPIILQLVDSLWCFTAHVVNCVLVAEPVGAFDRIIHMPSPVVLGHVTKGCVDASLGCYRMGSSWEL